MSTATHLIQPARSRGQAAPKVRRIRPDRAPTWKRAAVEPPPDWELPTSVLDEAERRLKASMQAIASRLHLGSGETEPSCTQAVLTGMEARIQIMAALHKARCRAGIFAQIDLAVFLRQAASLRNSPPRNPLSGGWTFDRDRGALAWTSSESETDDAILSDDDTDFDIAVQLLPWGWRDLARRAACACAIAFPPWIFRWASPRGILGRGGVAVSIQPTDDGVTVDVTLSDRGPGLPETIDAAQLRALGQELAAVLSELVQGGQIALDETQARFRVGFAPTMMGTSIGTLCPDAASQAA